MTKKWAEHFLNEPLVKLGIRHRKFYATRHTFITEAVKAAKELKDFKAIADYAGTSVAMIEQNYCARQQIKRGDREVFEKLAKKVNENMVAGPGFEHIGTSTTKRLQQLTTRNYEQWKKANGA